VTEGRSTSCSTTWGDGVATGSLCFESFGPNAPGDYIPPASNLERRTTDMMAGLGPDLLRQADDERRRRFEDDGYVFVEITDEELFSAPEVARERVRVEGGEVLNVGSVA
jgi:hypothetical protein